MEQCEATKRNYDHKAERAKLSPEQIDGLRRTASAQFGAAYNSGVVDCAGKRKDTETGEITDCPKRLMLVWMYRCWFCGQYFCPACAKEHFGDR